MKVIFSESQKAHCPRTIMSSGAPQPNLEAPERANRLLAAAIDCGLERETPPDYGMAPLAAVHTPEYLQFLGTIHARWRRIPEASEDVMPNVHPLGRGGAYPASAVGQVGWHVFDGAAPISADTWEAARTSAMCAVHGARALLAGAGACYALARPPGHHAGRDTAGGFCYLNNSAIGAQVLREQHARVAVLDIDVHHGNGTQDIFYDRPDVLTVSLHADPLRFYPFFWGYAGERGTDAGVGYNYNLPLPRRTGNDGYLEALARALARIDAYAPGALVVALGLDAHIGDPFQGLAVTTEGYARIAGLIAGLGLPTLLVQEGGYLSPELGDNLESFLRGFTEHHRPK